MPEKTPAQPNDIHRLILVSGVVVAVGLVIFLATRRPARAPTTTSIHQARIAAVTPQAYTSISGSITAVDPVAKTLATNFSYIDSQGHSQEKKYTVAVSDTTILQAVDQSVSPASVVTIDFSKLTVGDRVDIIADQNIASVDTFTATTILQYHH